MNRGVDPKNKAFIDRLVSNNKIKKELLGENEEHQESEVPSDDLLLSLRRIVREELKYMLEEKTILTEGDGVEVDEPNIQIQIKDHVFQGSVKLVGKIQK